jgi:hypothetical protein
VSTDAKKLKEITKIIRVLKKNGVKSYKNGDLEIVLEDPAIDFSSDTSKPKPRYSRKSDKIAESELNKEVVETREDQLAMMNIEDPAMFEQLLLERDLEDADRDKEKNH